MYSEPASKRASPSIGSPIIPRFRLSYNSAQQCSKNLVNEHRRQSSNLVSSQKFIKTSQRPERIQFNKNCNKPVYECKQNYSPIILEQKNLEMIQRNQPILTRRPVSAYETSVYTSRQEIEPTPAPSRPARVSPFDLGRSKMDSVCSKMTESIILSSDTLDSITQMSAPLSQECFERIKFLGQGKFGQVHLVKHKQTGFICALKIIEKRIVREQKVQSQIAKQIRIHSQLKSLNIIDFYGFFDDEKHFYILLQFATEGSVFSKLKGRSRLQQSQIQPIAKGLCDGLKFIHRMGYVHRDIKPENIVLQFGVPKICDFGWATDCDDVHLCKSYCGTPLYISPQMIRKQFYGSSVDIWAAGLVVYQLLVGRVPFSIWSQQDMNQILVKSIQFPQYIDRSENCQSFIRKCLEKQTFNRIQATSAMRHPFLNQEKQANFNYAFFQDASKLLSNYF